LSPSCLTTCYLMRDGQGPGKRRTSARGIKSGSDTLMKVWWSWLYSGEATFPIWRPTVPEATEERVTLTALAALLKRGLPLDGIESSMRRYHVEEKVESGRDRFTLINEASHVRNDDGSIRFNLRWDRSVEYTYGDESRLVPETNRAEICLREGPLGPMAFIYASLTLAPATAPQLSKALFRLQGQVVGITPTIELFDWILENRAHRVLQGGFKVTGLAELRYVTLNGDINPDENTDWNHFKDNGELRTLTYEPQGGNRVFYIHSRGVYSVGGPGVDASDLEKYVLETIVPHLGPRAQR